MKNFRKTIIALATAAAMLVPSVAMAATLTTEVDKDITGDVYVGFYDGAVLKDVVKTTVDAATVADTETAGTEEELPATVTITDVVDETLVRNDGKPVHKLVFKANADIQASATEVMISYDKNTVCVVPFANPSISLEPTGNHDASDFLQVGLTSTNYYPVKPASWSTTSTDIFGGTTTETTTMTFAGNLYQMVGDRVALKITQNAPSQKYMPITKAEGATILELYYVVKDNAEVTADTFKIETELDGDFLSIAGFASPGYENGLWISSPAGDLYYGCWRNKVAVANTIKLVTPWDVQEATTKTLEVTVPTGAESYKATMFIWDADQIAQCAPIALN